MWFSGLVWCHSYEVSVCLELKINIVMHTINLIKDLISQRIILLLTTFDLKCWNFPVLIILLRYRVHKKSCWRKKIHLMKQNISFCEFKYILLCTEFFLFSGSVASGGDINWIASRVLDDVVQPLRSNNVDEKEFMCLRTMIFFDPSKQNSFCHCILKILI